ncbi:MAG: helix-turn-helix domain-containing protein [Lactobacillales bacterium]|jgi:hypothetical protein|nr:helix-turn-helix domain-containing protein [Lactobacillales bacterium]
MQEWLIDKEYGELLGLLYTLFSEQRVTQTYQELTEKTGLRKEKIITLVQLFFAETSENLSMQDVEITLHSKSIGVIFHPTFHLNKYLSYFIKQSAAFQILETLFLDEFESVEKMAREINYSVATVQRKLKEIRIGLEAYDVKFSTRGKEYFGGTEMNIRYFFFCLYWKIYQLDEWPLTQVSEEKMSKAVEILYPENLEVEYVLENQLKIWLGVTEIRLKQGKNLRSFSKRRVPSSPFYPWEQFLSCYEKTIEQGFLLRGKNELNYLYLIIHYFHQPLLRDCQNLELEEQTLNDYLEEEAVTSWITTFEQVFSLELERYELFYLAVNLRPLFQFYQVHKGAIDPFGEEGLASVYQEKEPVWHIVHQKFQSELVQCKTHDFINYYIGNPRLSIIFGTLVQTIIENHRPVLKVLVYSKMGRIRRAMLEKKISENTEQRLKFVCSMEEQPDFIIGDQELYFKKMQEIPQIILHTFPDIMDWQRLRRYLAKLEIERLIK